jgi:hypothetical protein
MAAASCDRDAQRHDHISTCPLYGGTINLLAHTLPRSASPLPL